MVNLDIPRSVWFRFLYAGWHPWRRRRVAEDVPGDHPASAVLAVFGGLHVGRCGSGEECATSDIVFRFLEIVQDDAEISEWSELVGSNLVGIGEVCRSHGELYVAADGRFFGRSIVHEAFYFEGDSFGEAMESLLLGRRSRPLLRPNQTVVTLYGDDFTRDHPAVYDYNQPTKAPLRDVGGG